MAWKDAYINKLRAWWIRKIVRAQYYASNTGTWYEGNITEKSISGNIMTFKIETTDSAAMTITKVRLYDADGTEAYLGNRNIVKSSSEGALMQIDVPIYELPNNS